jgi:hypothetical protein
MGTHAMKASSSSNSSGARMSDNLADNLTEVADSLANVQYSESSDLWPGDDEDMYADIFNSMTEEMDGDDFDDAASDRSLDIECDHLSSP